MDLTLHVWRQKGPNEKGGIKVYKANNISPNCSFLEMLDVVNEGLIEKGEEPIEFDHDCREGICGTCSCTIDGIPHGLEQGVTTCQLHMRHFNDGDKIYIEPFRAKAFPVIKDLVVDRSAFDKIIQSGGFVSVNTGGTPDANSTQVSKVNADTAMDAAACIGCGACVAACKNASAMLFVAAKVGHLASLPQGELEREKRVQQMVKTMDAEGFGNCTNQFECSAVCPKDVDVKFIAKMNREYFKASLFGSDE